MMPRDRMENSLDPSNTKTTDPEACRKLLKANLLAITGEDGPWQRQIFFTFLFIVVISAGHNMSINFMAPHLDYWCAKPFEAANLSTEDWMNFGLPPNDTKCSRYKNIATVIARKHQNGTIISCESWEYDNSFYTSTILDKWDLVCGKKWLVSFSKSVFMMGLLVGGVLFGPLSDKVGRRPTIFMSCALAVASATGCAFSPSFLMFITCRFLVAVGVSGYYNNLFVLMMEVLDSNKRLIYGSIAQLGYSAGLVILPGVAWLIRDWFWLQITLAASSTIFLGTYWFIPESPRWLLSTGKLTAAKSVLMEAAKKNGRDDPGIEGRLDKAVANTDAKSSVAEEPEGNILDLVRTPGLRVITLTLFYGWMVISFIYYGLTFNTNDLFGDPFINFAISGAVEFPATLIAIPIIMYCGRRIPVASALIVGGTISLLSNFISQETTFFLAVVMAGRLCITGCYVIIHIYTSELLPTVLRTTGLGCATFFEEVGAIVAPFVHELSMHTGSFVPFLVYGLLALTSGLLFLLLPETRDRKIPDFVSEAADASSSQDSAAYGGVELRQNSGLAVSVISPSYSSMNQLDQKQSE